MPTPCRSCGAEPRDGARFCDACGAPIAAAERRAEYKQVTVLFADVVGSMDLAATLGPERLREVMGDLFTRASTIVARYGGTVDKFTGDGLMAVFGAPIALEDHAVRACRAALDIQADVRALAADVERRDKVGLQLRIGLNSGEVITGEIGSSAATYTAVGEQVGFAQRMESAAPPGGVMVSESTARLVDTAALLGDREQVHIKGAVEPVPARLLLGMAAGRRSHRIEPAFVGRDWEMAALQGVFERSMGGKGSVVGVVGPPGIGKSRIVRELTARAQHLGADVFTTYCESHTTDVAFNAVAGLLRSTSGVEGLDDGAARERLRTRFHPADDEDLLILADLIGIRDPEAVSPQIDPDARRRRVSATVKAAALSRTTPAVYVIEDAHWIDEVSEAMIADFLAVIPLTPSLVLITYRPEYAGALAHTPRSQTITLEPLGDSQMLALSAELLGGDSSVAELHAVVAERAAGNPFFAEEIVRDLSERDVLVGGRGCYLCTDSVADVHVPSTLQAVIAARIDRLEPAAKQTLNAAAVIGSRFTTDTLAALGVDVEVDELVSAELVDTVSMVPQVEYTFRHPLIRAVAYDSQLKSDRAQLHRRVAAMIDEDDENAALIAEHLESAGDLPAAFQWHMQAGGWSANRNIAAAQLSWERALHAADTLPPEFPGRTAMRIAPRTLICANTWKSFHRDIATRYNELHDLCMDAGDKASLAMGMAGLTVENVLQGNIREASRLASEYMAVVESIADPNLTVALSFAGIVAKHETGETTTALRWTQAVIDLATQVQDTGMFIFDNPLATALTWRGVARFRMGAPGFRDDFDRATAIAERSDSLSRSTIIAYKYAGIPRGVFIATDAILREIEFALERVERSSDDISVVLLRMNFAVALIHRGADPARGFDVMRELRQTCLDERFALNLVSLFDTYIALERAHTGEAETAIDQWRSVADDMERVGQNSNIDLPIMFMAERLIDSGAFDEAKRQIDRLHLLAEEHQWGSREICAHRLRTLLARASGDMSTYRQLRDEYRSMAVQMDFEGHIKWAAALP